MHNTPVTCQVEWNKMRLFYNKPTKPKDIHIQNIKR